MNIIKTPLTNEEFLKLFGMAYDEYLDQFDDDDFEINIDQFEHYCEIVAFLQAWAARDGGEIEVRPLVPKECHAWLSGVFDLIELRGDDVKVFCELLKHASCFGVDLANYGSKLLIEITVPDVFVERK